MNFVTVLQGKKYSPLQVERLAAQVRGWCDCDEFRVHTDHPSEHFGNWITHSPLPLQPYLKGWWSKLVLYSQTYDQPTIFLDIDCQIRDSFSVTHTKDKIGMPLDYLARYHPHKNIQYVNSSIQALHGNYRGIWEWYTRNWQMCQNVYRGDQEMLWGQWRNKIYYLEDSISESYKWSALQRGYGVAPIINYHGENVKDKV